MDSPAWMLLRLAVETRAHHAAADGDRLAPMEEPSVDAYRAYLAVVYGFDVAVEHALIRTAGLDLRVLRARAKRGRLAQDLLELGMTPDELARTPRCVIAPFRSTAEAFGWLYVVERNTLLFGLLRRHLARDRALARASSYLACYGDTPGAMFRQLGDLIDGEAERGPAQVAQLIGASHRAFAGQRAWFVACAPRSRERTPLAS